MAGPNTNSNVGKKPKARASVPPDPVEASRQIAAKIAQLERETAGEKDQDAEIDQEVRKANREISQLLSKVESPTERVDMIRDKYLSLVADFKRLDRDYQKIKKRADQYARERDALRTDLTKSDTVKQKLAKMSRDNLAEVKVLKASLERMETTEVQSRQELHERLDGMVSDIHSVVLNPGLLRRNVISAEPDLEFRSKFESFVLQQELRELQYLSMLRTMHLVQLSQDARLERKTKAQELETSRTHQLSRQVSAISQTESELRSQLNVYVEKFRQVEETLNSSNDLFLTFRKEMEDMSKKTKRLEKENQLLMRKVETSNRNVLELAEERNRVEKRYLLMERRNMNLEKLCRGMQAQGRTLPTGQTKTPVEESLSPVSPTASPPPQQPEQGESIQQNKPGPGQKQQHHNQHQHGRSNGYVLSQPSLSLSNLPDTLLSEKLARSSNQPNSNSEPNLIPMNAADATNRSALSSAPSSYVNVGANTSTNFASGPSVSLPSGTETGPPLHHSGQHQDNDQKRVPEAQDHQQSQQPAQSSQFQNHDQKQKHKALFDGTGVSGGKKSHLSPAVQSLASSPGKNSLTTGPASRSGDA